MKKSKDAIYPIDFHALGLGETGVYDFEINDRFFEHWPESEVQHGSGKVHVEVSKHASMMDLTVNIEGEAEVTCDRCLDPFMIHVGFEGTPVVKISEVIPEGEGYDDNQSDGETLWINPADEVLDLGQYAYESIILSLPFQRTHPDLADCNPDMLSRFKIVTEEEFDELVGEEEETQSPFAGLAEQLKEKEDEER